MKCNHCQSRILDLIPLPSGENFPEDIQRHLSDCPGCRQFYREHARAIQAIRPATPPSVPAGFKDNLMRGISGGEMNQHAMQPHRAAQYRLWKPVYITVLAALILIGLLLFEPRDWFPAFWKGTPGIPADIRLAQAFASEFRSAPRAGVLHLSSEITFQPLQGFYGEDEQWYPITIINEKGLIETIKISFKSGHRTKRVIQDESWYDFDRRCFIRTLSMDNKVFFVNAFDGSEIVLSGSENHSANFSLQQFKLPQPEEFLIMAASLSVLWADSSEAKIVNSITHKKYQGDPIQQIKATVQKNDANTYRYYFNLSPDGNQILEVNTYVHKVPLLTVRPGSMREEQENAYPSIHQIQTHTEITNNFRFGKLSVLPYLRTISPEQMRESAWQGLLYAEPSPNHYLAAGITSILDFGFPAKRMFAFVYESPDSQPVILLQSCSLNRIYGSKLKEVSRLVQTTEKGLRVFECPLLDSAVEHIIPIIQPASASQMSDAHGYLLEHPEGSYALLITSEPTQNKKVNALLENLTPQPPKSTTEAQS